MSTIDEINGTTAAEHIAYNPVTGVDKTDETEENGEFARLLEEALRELTTGSMTGAMNSGALGGDTMMGMGMPGGFMSIPSVNNTLEQAILKASSTGNSEDAMMALCMLMMMMQSSTSGGGGEMGMMLQMMAAMMEQMQEKDIIRDKFMYSSGGQPYTLDTIDTQVFKNTIPDTTGTTQAVLPLEWWRPTTPAIVSDMNERSPELYRAVLDQFDVEKAERYRPGREGNTYCNIYVWDATRAMGAELPYYCDPSTGAPMQFPDTKGAKVNLAKDMDAWLKQYGPQYGWHQATAEEAQRHANQGKPAMTAAGDIGHVQMVAPSTDGSFDPIRGVTIAQAGAKVSNYMYISEIYGASALANKVTYWIHE